MEEQTKKLLIGKVLCPYCHKENIIQFDPFDLQFTIILCDNEIGGCDQYFAVKPSKYESVNAISFDFMIYKLVH